MFSLAYEHIYNIITRSTGYTKQIKSNIEDKTA